MVPGKGCKREVPGRDEEGVPGRDEEGVPGRGWSIAFPGGVHSACLQSSVGWISADWPVLN